MCKPSSFSDLHENIILQLCVYFEVCLSEIIPVEIGSLYIVGKSLYGISTGKAVKSEKEIDIGNGLIVYLMSK